MSPKNDAAFPATTISKITSCVLRGMTPRSMIWPARPQNKWPAPKTETRASAVKAGFDSLRARDDRFGPRAGRARTRAQQQHDGDPTHRASIRMNLELWMVLLAAGAGAGVLAGLLGIGGGFVFVPALLLVFREHGVAPDAAMPLAVGT